MVTDTSNQMVTLANQIIAAMPEHIKLSPARDTDLTSDLSELSATSSTDDSGIVTTLDSMSYDEYR